MAGRADGGLGPAAHSKQVHLCHNTPMPVHLLAGRQVLII